MAKNLEGPGPWRQLHCFTCNAGSYFQWQL